MTFKNNDDYTQFPDITEVQALALLFLLCFLIIRKLVGVYFFIF